MNDEVKEEWSISEGVYDGHRIVVRQNVGVRAIIAGTQYPFRAGIAIPSLKPQKDGMPAKEEIEPFNRIEDLIYDYFKGKHIGVLCLVLTTQCMKEFIVYSSTDNADDLLGSLSHHFPAYDIQHYVALDKDWEAYRQWDS